MRLKTYCLFALLPFSVKRALAQNNTAQESFKMFFEKVYLHLDRNLYAAGEDIWFKAYLVNAQSNYITATSNNLYTELIDPEGNIAAREVIRLENGTGRGDFKLPDTLEGGNYRVRAYTNWMRNFGNHFVFEKTIQIQNIALKTGKGGHSAQNSGRATAASFTPENRILFFPESGSMVEGLSSLVSFKAEDAAGNGLPAKGFVLSSKGDTAARFQSGRQGMGHFMFRPEPGMDYKAVVQYGNRPYEPAEFPIALLNGFVMHIDNADTSRLNVKISASKATAAQQTLTLVGRHGGRICYRDSTKLTNGEAAISIPKKDFPEGIASITLYDANLHPHCERLVYVEKNDPLLVTVSTDKKTYNAKEPVRVNISVTDAQNRPVKAALSLAAIDNSLAKSATGNILTYLELESEVAGKIENPSQYFDPANPSRRQDLDLLLRTQGWRSFLWRQIADTNLHISYLPEGGITISGRVRTLLADKPLPNMNITLIAPGAQGDKMYATRTDKDGKYYLDGLVLYGSQGIKINSKNDKGKKGGWLFLDTLFGKPLAAYPHPNPGLADTTGFSRFVREAALRGTSGASDPLYKTLEGVTVTNERKTVTLRDGSTYMSFGYPEYNYNITSADYQYKIILDFLVQKVPGAHYDNENDGINFIANGKTVRPRFFVDKQEDVFERMDYYAVPMQQVNSIRVRHVVGGMGAINDVFLIYLSLKPGAFNQDMAFINTNINGYYEARQFYAPNYAFDDKAKADLRTTLHWEPNIVTDENGKASVTFYNADPQTKVAISVQGLAAKGKVVAAETSYEAKGNRQ